MKKAKKSAISLVFILAMLVMFLPSGGTDVFASPGGYPNTYTNTGDQRADIIGVAKTQLGYTEGSNNDTKYGNWYGLPHQDWCAMFVSWCARQANIPTSVLKNSSCAGWSSKYFDVTRYDGNSYTPKPGDLFFERDGSHVGLVYYLDGNYFYSIEGNHNNKVCSIRKAISGYYFGVPNYLTNTPTPGKITNLSVSVGEGGKCTFKWSGVSNAQKYVVKIWKDNLWEGNPTYESNASSGHMVQLRAGKYIAYVDALNGSQCVMSNAVTFTVSGINAKRLNLNQSRYARIRNVGTGNYLTVNSEGNVVSSPKSNSTNQIWYMEHLGNNKHRLTSQYNGKCLDVSNGGYKDETNVWSIHWNNTAAQKWYIFRIGDYFGMRPECSDCTVLDVYETSKKSGTNVQLFSYHGGANQQFDFEEVKYTVTYNANGGTGAPGNQTKVYNTALTLSNQKPTKTGYAFVKWTTNTDGSGTGYNAGASYTANAGTTLYAQWIELYVYDVNFNLNGENVPNLNNIGSFDVYMNNKLVADDVTDYCVPHPKGTTFEVKDIKVKDGYQYDGVHYGNLKGTLNGKNGVRLNFSTKKYTVTYNANGGTGAPGNQTKVHGQTLTLSTSKPTRNEKTWICCYVFSHWNTKADGTGTTYTPGQRYYANGNVTLYAQWLTYYYFDLSGYINGAKTTNITNYGTADVYINGKLVADDVTDFFRPYPPETKYEIKDIKAMYVTQYNGVYSGALSGTIRGTTTTHLNFSTKKYTVTYNANGGTGAPGNQTKVHGKTLTLSNQKPARTGYAFVKWTTNADGSGTSYNAGASYTANAGATLYAQWKSVSVSSITIKTLPTKMTYTVGQEFDPAGMTVKVNYADGTSKVISSGFSYTPNGAMNTAGQQAIAVSYQGKGTGFRVTVNDKAVSSIAIKKLPTKMTYTVGQKFDPAGMTIKVNYADGTNKVISSGFSYTPNGAMNTVGQQAIAVSYQGKGTGFRVTVS